MSDLIDRQTAMDAIAKFVPYAICDESTKSYTNGLKDAYDLICQLPSAQPEYEELTPEEAASEIASGSIITASYWLDLMMRLKQMGYAICRKR